MLLDCVLSMYTHEPFTRMPNVTIVFPYPKVPLNNKETMLQRQLSIRDETETEAGLEALEEPLKAKKRRESETRQGIQWLRKFSPLAFLHSFNNIMAMLVFDEIFPA